MRVRCGVVARFFGRFSVKSSRKRPINGATTNCINRNCSGGFPSPLGRGEGEGNISLTIRTPIPSSGPAGHLLPRGEGKDSFVIVDERGSERLPKNGASGFSMGGSDNRFTQKRRRDNKKRGTTSVLKSVFRRSRSLSAAEAPWGPVFLLTRAVFCSGEAIERETHVKPGSPQKIRSTRPFRSHGFFSSIPSLK